MESDRRFNMIEVMYCSPYDRLPDGTVPNLRGFQIW